jgi:hypothetical protein
VEQSRTGVLMSVEDNFVLLPPAPSIKTGYGVSTHFSAVNMHGSGIPRYVHNSGYSFSIPPGYDATRIKMIMRKRMMTMKGMMMVKKFKRTMMMMMMIMTAEIIVITIVWMTSVMIMMVIMTLATTMAMITMTITELK